MTLEAWLVKETYKRIKGEDGSGSEPAVARLGKLTDLQLVRTQRLCLQSPGMSPRGLACPPPALQSHGAAGRP